MNQGKSKDQIFSRHDTVFKSHHLLMALIDLAKQRDIHPDRLLKGSRLFYQDIIHSQTLISYSQIERVVRNALKLLPQGDLAFLIGRRLFPGHLHEIAPILLNCESLTSLMRVIYCRQSLFFPFVFLTMQRSENKLCILPWQSMSIQSDEIERFFIEVWLGVMTSVIKWRLGYIPNMRLSLSYNQPKYVEQYHVNLLGRIEFSQPLTMVSCDLSAAKLRFEENNISLKRYLYSRQPAITQASLLQWLVCAMLKHDIHNIEQACQRLAISPATLKRKLRDYDCNFQLLLDYVRRKQAVFQITELGFNNEQVATEMAFSDTTNFRRAFKRWTGMTPNDLRQQSCT